MFKLLFVCLSVILSGVVCDLGKEEGSECEWEGFKGTCVHSRRCLTSLDSDEPKQPVCSGSGDSIIICCTDCELVNDTRNALVSPTGGGIFWKDGRKARDACIDYIRDLPYQCRQEGFYGGLRRVPDKEKKCHNYGIFAIGGAPPRGQEFPYIYPHQALLGYGEDLETAKWQAGGSIISDRYILTAAHSHSKILETLNFVAVGVLNIKDGPAKWQTYKIKSRIVHPKYERYSNDIGLIETETPIQFSEKALPACLFEGQTEDEYAIASTWREVPKLTDSTEKYIQLADSVQTLEVQKYSKEECTKYFPESKDKRRPSGFNYTIQLCYGNREHPNESCNGFSGEGLTVDTYISGCVRTIIGITSYGPVCGPSNKKPDLYTRVSHYVPWIESIVWP